MANTGSYRPSNFRYVQSEEDDSGTNILGGRVVRLVAGGTLLFGDVVCLVSGSNFTVNKSVASAVHRSVVGIVVGGQSLPSGAGQYYTSTDTALYNVATAAIVGQDVLVQINGVALGILAGAYAVGTILIPDTGIAGRLLTDPDYTVVAGAVAVTSNAANGAGIVTGQSSRMVGKLLRSGVAGDVREILILL